MDSIRGTAFLQFGELLASHGASMRDFLVPHQVPLDVVGNYEKQFSYKSLVRIFEDSAQALQMPEFGLELATRQGSSLLGPLQHLARSAATVGDALVAVLRYMRVYSPAIHYSLERRPGQALLYFDNALPCGAETPQIVEKSILHGSLLVSELLGTVFKPKNVLFRHPPQATRAVYQRYFDCPVLFRQAHNALALAPEDLQQPCSQYDPVLHDILRFYLEAHCMGEDDLQAKVGQQIQILLPRQRCSLEQVAQMLGLHARTLQRRLANEGVEFEYLVEQTRCRQARSLLQNTALSVTQIAQELGYRRTASFCRAHARWYGCTPLEHRQSQLQDKEAAVGH
ncbi:AraC family transcriptional regulator [Pseudomonas guariconensis]|uniref:AraC family transcriptional regulator n=1 Tax=Pseudomonas TaxID=286 RepID=UPI002096D665|nr:MULTISPECIES: AraC family transcriptional regulator [Pseudomonas]MCO7639380.1 AraC family transcriptional regulator [Pseudomonas sp. S 311-6]MCO7515154.1 AraC family transcriptional regulator [Pseudomonas putida]MCO7565084.1 AraC family transcriptional regulator [Pseudomonas mosselii]MCO7605031.1 AraC family transcriptional regulator [Pseudomonas guariconensis]MCO7616317.1 AraC family transcriptional regulator [Pseudomonas guariconensis]